MAGLTTSLGPSEMRPDDRRSFPARLAVAGVGVIGFVALGAAGLLAIPTSVLAAGAYLGASYAPVALPERPQTAWRKTASVAVLLAVAAAAAVRALSGMSAQISPIEVGTTLAILVAGLQVAQALVVDSRRDLTVGLAVGVFVIVLAAGLGPPTSVAVPVLAGWPVALLAGGLLARLDLSGPSRAVVAKPGRIPAGFDQAGGLAGGFAGGRAGGLAGGRAGGLAGRPGDGASPTPNRAGVAPAFGMTVSIAAAIVAGLVVFAVLPQPTGIRPHLWTGTNGTSAAQSTSAQGARNLTYYSSGVMDLRTRGTLSDQPVAVVPSSSPPLWAGAVLDTYDGDTWTSAQGTPTLLSGGPQYEVPHPLYPLTTGSSRTDQVRIDPAFTGVVIAPGAITGLTADGPVGIAANGSLLVDPNNLGGAGGSGSYTVASTVPVTDAATLRAARGTDASDPEWLQLPAELPARVRSLAHQITAGAPTRYDAVLAVEDYLRAHETYELDSPVPAPGADAVDNFLFVSHSGFCEQFASAEVVLLRAVGIPSRLVSGFGYGTPDGTGSRLFRVSNAHAWAEIWYPGVGWSPSDPTAGARLAPGSARTGLSGLLHSLSGARGRIAGAAVLLLGFLLGAAIAIGVRHRRARRFDVETLVPGGRSALRSAFTRLEASLAAAGRARRPDESVAELGRRLIRGGTQPARGTFMTVQQDLYSSTPPSGEDCGRAIDDLDRMASELAPATAAAPGRPEAR